MIERTVPLTLDELAQLVSRRLSPAETLDQLVQLIQHGIQVRRLFRLSGRTQPRESDSGGDGRLAAATRWGACGCPSRKAWSGWWPSRSARSWSKRRKSIPGSNMFRNGRGSLPVVPGRSGRGHGSAPGGLGGPDDGRSIVLVARSRTADGDGHAGGAAGERTAGPQTQFSSQTYDRARACRAICGGVGIGSRTTYFARCRPASGGN